MKFIKLFTLIPLLLASSINAAPVINPSVEDNHAKCSPLYNITHFAKYLGMSPEAYYKFSGAYAMENASSMLPHFIDIQLHPAFIEAQTLLSGGLEVSESLILEIEALFKKNQELFADYMGMDVSELVGKQKQFEQLTTVINRLESKRLSQLGRDSSGSPQPLSSQSVDETEVIAITANENSIRETSSGEFTALITTIYNLSMGSNGGLGGTFEVEYTTSSGYYGSQEWYVDRFTIYPTGNTQVFSSSAR